MGGTEALSAFLTWGAAWAPVRGVGVGVGLQKEGGNLARTAGSKRAHSWQEERVFG